MIAIYKRLSLSDGDLGVDGKDESNSIENQQLMIEQYLDSKEEFNGIDRITYSDDGYTGTDFNRPGFKEMIDAAKSGKIDTIVVKDVSRFGRDYIGVGEYLEQIFPILNIRFIAINNGYDSKKYSGETLGLDMVVANLVNTMYSRDSGKKLYAANSVKWKQGISTYANTTFGYKKDPNRKGRYIIDPDAAKIVRRIFDLALEGRTTTQIAAQLNEEKVPVPYEYNQQTEDRKSVGACKPIAEKVIWSSRRVLRILKKYGIAIGINEPLLKYRLTNSGKSGSKLKSAVMTFRVYRYMGFSWPKSAVCFISYALHGVWKYLTAGWKKIET